MKKVIAGMLLVLLLLVVSTPVLAQLPPLPPLPAPPVITVGDHDLLPGTPFQQIEFYVTGGNAVSGFNLYAQVEDGGPEAAAVGWNVAGVPGPSITEVDLLTGTIFESNNAGQLDSGVFVPQFREGNTTTYSGLVAADGLVATATFDTTGFTTVTDQFDLMLANVAGGIVSSEFTMPMPTWITDNDDPDFQRLASEYYVKPFGNVTAGEIADFRGLLTADYEATVGSNPPTTVVNGTITIADFASTETLTSKADGAWKAGATWNPDGATPGTFTAVEVLDDTVVVEEDREGFSLSINDGAAKVSVAVGKQLAIHDGVQVTSGTLATQITGADAGLLHVGNTLDLSGANDQLGLDWIPDGPGSEFGGTYEIAHYGSLSGTFEFLDGGNIGSAYIQDIDYISDDKIAVSLYDLLAGDTDIDGDVDSDDYVALKLNFGMTSNATPFDGDTDFDGDVDSDDYVALKLHFGNSVPSSKGGAEVVPEPGTLAMLLLGAVSLLGYSLSRRRNSAR